MISENVARALRKVRPNFRTALQGEKIVWCDCVVAAAQVLTITPGEMSRFVRIAGGMSLRRKRMPEWARKRLDVAAEKR